MLITILSDSHDNIDALEWALDASAARGVDHGIHCGDIIAEFMVERMACASFPIFSVFGNNDKACERLQSIAKQDGSTLTFSGDMFGEIEIDHQKIFVCHYPHDAQESIASKKYDAVFYGHTHTRETHVEDGTVVCNPGEIYGHRTGVTSFALYNTMTRSIEFIIK